MTETTEPTTQPRHVLAWHFLAADGKMAHHKNTLVRVGKTYTCRGPISLCNHGLHASVRILDALRYAPGPICCRVEMIGTIQHGQDKLCSTRRTVLAMADITTILHEFSCDVAENALKIAKVDDPRSWAAIEEKRAWLRGEITDEELAAAWAAARDAAWAAARDAASVAANAAAWDAAWDAAWAAQNADLERRVLTAMGLETTEGGAV